MEYLAVLNKENRLRRERNAKARARRYDRKMKAAAFAHVDDAYDVIETTLAGEQAARDAWDDGERSAYQYDGRIDVTKRTRDGGR